MDIVKKINKVLTMSISGYIIRGFLEIIPLKGGKNDSGLLCKMQKDGRDKGP